jgi:hypothetical protein
MAKSYPSFHFGGGCLAKATPADTCTYQGSNLQPYDPKSQNTAIAALPVRKEAVETRAASQGEPGDSRNHSRSMRSTRSLSGRDSFCHSFSQCADCTDEQHLRLITGIRTTYDASGTAIASRTGASMRPACQPTGRAVPTAQPTSVFTRRLRNILRPCLTTRSVEAIAQIGLT